MTAKEIISVLEGHAPLMYQESYDNSGLQIGDANQKINAILLTIDVTMDILDEAIQKKANLIISHHPLLFEGLKNITGATIQQQIIRKAIKQDMVIYAAHTNFDNIYRGVNYSLCHRLSISNPAILRPIKGALFKLVTFVPHTHADRVRSAMFEDGAGVIGDYDQCSFNISGKGTFRGGDTTHPFVGEKGKLHVEEEVRIETIVPGAMLGKAISDMMKAHPYEEVAYDVYPLENDYPMVGAGMIGELEKEMSEKIFMDLLKKTFRVKHIRHSKLLGKKIKRVAVCGGSGSFLLRDTLAQQADIFISGDFKYHQFFEAEGKIVIADIGHFESEQFTKDIFYDLLIKKFPTFAIHFSEINTNPINYY